MRENIDKYLADLLDRYSDVRAYSQENARYLRGYLNAIPALATLCVRKYTTVSYCFHSKFVISLDFRKMVYFKKHILWTKYYTLGRYNTRNLTVNLANRCPEWPNMRFHAVNLAYT